MQIEHTDAYEPGMSTQVLFTNGANLWNEELELDMDFFDTLAAEYNDMLVRKDIVSPWPRGRGMALYPLGNGNFVFESHWFDYGSGSNGDHNLYVISLDPLQILTGVDIGGTHTLNASMAWWPRNQLLSLGDASSFYNYDIPLVWFPKDGSPVISWIDNILERNALTTKLGEALTPDDGVDSYRVLDFAPSAAALKFCVITLVRVCDEDSGTCSDQDCDCHCDYMPPEQTCEQASTNDRFIVFEVPWEDIFGKEFSFVPSQKETRWPEKIMSSDGHWQLLSANDRFYPPEFQLYAGGAATPDETDAVFESTQFAGFSRHGFWSLANNYLTVVDDTEQTEDYRETKTLYWASLANLENHTVFRTSIPNLQDVQPMADGSLMLTTSESLLKMSLDDGNVIEFLRRTKRPRMSQEQLFTAMADAAPTLDRACLLKKLKQDWAKGIVEQTDLYDDYIAANKANLKFFITRDDWYKEEVLTQITEALRPCGAEPIPPGWTLWNEETDSLNPPLAIQKHRVIWWKLWTIQADPGQEKWTSAWRIGPGDYVIFEQLFQLKYGEFGHLLRIKLKTDPFGSVETHWLNEN